MNKYLKSLEKIDKIAFVILAIFLVLIIMGCEYGGDDPDCPKGEKSPGVVCVEIYDPVCAPDGTTYSNSCYAEKDGWDNGCLQKC